MSRRRAFMTKGIRGDTVYKRMKLLAATLALLVSVGALACGSDAAQPAGEPLFADNCARCHGAMADGTQSGPPLVHRLYEPGHHPDFTFYRAVSKGVIAHHWDFGDMPPVAGLSGRRGDSDYRACQKFAA